MSDKELIEHIVPSYQKEGLSPKEVAVERAKHAAEASKKLSPKYHKAKKKEQELHKELKAAAADTAEEAAEEAAERMKYMELDDLYQERQFQNAMVEIISAERGSTKWSPQDKMKAVMAYLISGSTYQAAELTNIPVTTIKVWRASAPWWPKALEYAKNARKEGLVSRLGEVQDLALEAVVDRLKHGDSKYNTKTGEIVKVPVSARDAMFIASSAQDKGQVLKGEATNITEKKVSQDALLNKIAERFEKALERADMKVIEGVVIK